MEKIIISLLLIFLIFSSNCMNNVEDNTGVIPDGPISFSADVNPILVNRCGACHGVGQNGFNSSSYNAIMASVSPSSRYNGPYVVSGNADASPLIDKLEPNPQFGTRMPQGSSLSGNEIEIIRTWINEGAQNN